MADGYLNYCIVCKRTEIAERRSADPEKERARDRARGFREYDRTKTLARQAVQRALRSGELERKPCEVCGNEKADAHHDDYDKPIDVRWLCRKHHAEHHRKFK